MTDSEISKELNTISSLNGWGVLGVFVPIIGLICCGVSYSRATKLMVFMNENQKKKYQKIVQGRKAFSTTLTIICLLISIFWIFVWIGLSNNSY